MNKEPDAKGGNGNVYFSEDGLTATKCLRNTSTTEKIARYKREVEVMQSLRVRSLPNIVEVISAELDEKNPAKSKIIMKRYDGCLKDLATLTKGNVELTLQLLLPIVRALKSLSENTSAIYHRDIKPENLLYLEKDGKYELFLTDFGICFLKDSEDRLTEEISAVGARMYLAPEYEIGRVENVTEKGDIFSIGKVIWWMINGEENALLPSNFWFVDDFDLTKKFTNNPRIVAANMIIAACLKRDPNERCDYDQLTNMMNEVLNPVTISADAEKQYKVEVAMERQRILFAEKLAQNKQLVNRFSTVFLQALHAINAKYPTITFLQTLETEYRKRSKDGVDYTTRNVDNDASHYLYDRNFDNIYIAMNYHPASKGKKYANITLQYSIRSSGKKETLTVYYGEECVMLINYHEYEGILCLEVVVQFIEDMISNYLL